MVLHTGTLSGASEAVRPYANPYEIELLRSSTEHQVLIVHQGEEQLTIQGIFADENLSLECASTYDPAFAAAEGAISMANNWVSAIARQFFSSGLTLKNRFMSRLKWAGSSNPTLNVPMLFIAIDENESETKVMVPIRDLWKAILPTTREIPKTINALGREINVPFAGTEVLQAPMGFTDGRNNQGKFTVYIGNWFVMPNAIMTSMTPNIGAHVGPDEQPLWATAQVGFTYYQTATADEVRGFFKGQKQHAQG